MKIFKIKKNFNKRQKSESVLERNANKENDNDYKNVSYLSKSQILIPKIKYDMNFPLLFQSKSNENNNNRYMFYSNFHLEKMPVLIPNIYSTKLTKNEKNEKHYIFKRNSKKLINKENSDYNIYKKQNNESYSNNLIETKTINISNNYEKKVKDFDEYENHIKNKYYKQCFIYNEGEQNRKNNKQIETIIYNTKGYIPNNFHYDIYDLNSHIDDFVNKKHVSINNEDKKIKFLRNNKNKIIDELNKISNNVNMRLNKIENSQINTKKNIEYLINRKKETNNQKLKISKINYFKIIAKEQNMKVKENNKSKENEDKKRHKKDRHEQNKKQIDCYFEENKQKKYKRKEDEDEENEEEKENQSKEKNHEENNNINNNNDVISIKKKKPLGLYHRLCGGYNSRNYNVNKNMSIRNIN